MFPPNNDKILENTEDKNTTSSWRQGVREMAFNHALNLGQHYPIKPFSDRKSTDFTYTNRDGTYNFIISLSSMPHQTTIVKDTWTFKYFDTFL